MIIERLISDLLGGLCPVVSFAEMGVFRDALLNRNLMYKDWFRSPRTGEYSFRIVAGQNIANKPFIIDYGRGDSVKVVFIAGQLHTKEIKK